MSLLNKKSAIHNHLSRPVHKKPSPARVKDAESSSTKVDSGLGKLQVGKEAPGEQAAYKPIFGL